MFIPNTRSNTCLQRIFIHMLIRAARAIPIMLINAVVTNQDIPIYRVVVCLPALIMGNTFFSENVKCPGKKDSVKDFHLPRVLNSSRFHASLTLSQGFE